LGLFDGTACSDPVFCAELDGFGPYKDEQGFNEGLIRAMKLSQDSTWVDLVARFIRALPAHDIVLTHSDFSPRNILVRGDQVVAILDWEMSGFYPEFWEYVKALYHPEWQSAWMVDGAVAKILKPYDLELAVLLHMQQVVW
jgi:thiamine kinase-like enzyme